MIYSVSGTLTYTDTTYAVVECSGVGFKCIVSLNTIKTLPAIGKDVKLLTYMSVKEDSIDLFGFADSSELEMFRFITSVSGVGPKVAMAILSEFTADRLCLLIASGDSKSITRAQGVGTKLAQRIVLELKDKVGATSFADEEDVAAVTNVGSSQNVGDAIEALVSLGYSQSEASLAVGKLDRNLPVEKLIKEGLKSLAKF